MHSDWELGGGERWAIFLACFLFLLSWAYYAQLEEGKEAKKSPLFLSLSFPLSCEIYAQGCAIHETIGDKFCYEMRKPHRL